MRLIINKNKKEQKCIFLEWPKAIFLFKNPQWHSKTHRLKSFYFESLKPPKGNVIIDNLLLIGACRKAKAITRWKQRTTKISKVRDENISECSAFNLWPRHSNS